MGSEKTCQKCGSVIRGWKHSYNRDNPEITIACLQSQIDQMFGMIGELEKKLKDKDV